jgi:hypothetical protein
MKKINKMSRASTHGEDQMTVHIFQNSETNVMHFFLNLLRIKGLYIFRALLAHPQEVLHKRHLLYCVRVVSVGCTRIIVHHVGFPILIYYDARSTTLMRLSLCRTDLHKKRDFDQKSSSAQSEANNLRYYAILVQASYDHVLPPPGAKGN